MRILGIDPGTITMGYGVVESDGDHLNAISYGVLTPSSRSPIAQRLHTLHCGLIELIADYQPSIVAIEQPFVAKNARSALAVGRAQAVAMLAAAANGIPVYEYTPTQVKQSVTDYGGADKIRV